SSMRSGYSWVSLPRGMMMMVVMARAVLVAVAMVVAVRVAAHARAARVLAEHQRLDGDGHGVRGHAHAAEVDVVEIPERHAVDHQHLGGEAPLFLEERAQRMRDVAVEHQVERLRLEERHGQ